MKTPRYSLLLLLFFGLVLCTPSCSTDLEEDLMDSELSQDDDDKDDDAGKTDDDDEDDDDDDDDEDDDEVIRHPTLYFVRLDPDISEDEVEDLLDDLNSEEVWFREEINLRLWNTVEFPYTSMGGENVTNIDGHVARARGRTRVKEVNFNIGSIISQPTSVPPLSCFESIVPQYPLGSNAIKISIFDTGITGLTGADIPGYSFAVGEYTGYDYVDNDEIPEDENGHGTHVAGLIHHLLSQEGNVGSTVSFDIRKTHDKFGQGFVSNLIPAVLDAVNDGAHILNFSFGYQDSNTDPTGRPLKLAVDYAEQMGALIVASAGNTNKNNDVDTIVSFPASYPNDNILSVASTDCDNKLSPFSSYGNQSVDVGLLGENIPGPDLTMGMDTKSGTSFASANVAAMVAILGTHQATFDHQQIRCTLINTSAPASDLFEKVASNGVIDFSAAFDNLGESCN